MSQLDDQLKSTATINVGRENLLHDLRDRLNTIQTSAMVLDRKGSVSPEDKKFLDWILEKTNEASELVDLIGKDNFGDIGCDNHDHPTAAK